MWNRPIQQNLVLSLLILPILFQACTIPEKPVTKDEAIAFSHRIEKSVEHGNSVLLDNIFDEEGFGKRVASDGNRILNKELKDGAIQGIKAAHFGQQILQSIGKQGTYKLVKQYEKDNRQHLLFRLYGDGSVNYHDYELVKRDENIKAIDIYIYLSGENLSKTFAQALMMMQDKMPDMSKGDMDKVNKMKTIKTLIAQKDYAKAGEYYDELPADFKKQKLFQLIHIQIGSGMGNEQYGNALNEYKSLFPNDPNMYLMMVDAYVLQKDYPKALDAVNKLDSIINKDPFQDYYRGLMYKLMLDTPQSLACFERLHAYMPGFTSGTVELVTVYLKTGNMDKAVQLVKQTKEDKSLDPETVDALYELHPDLHKAMQKTP